MTVNNWGAARKAAVTILEGEFSVVVVEASATESQGGKEQIKLKLKITGGPYVTRPLWDTITISPESPVAMGMFFRAMEAFGLGDQFFATLPDGKQGTAMIAAALQGKEITAIVKKEAYQGVDREKIKGYKPLQVGGTGAVPGMGAPVLLAAAPLAAALPAPVPLQPATAPPLFGGDLAGTAESAAFALAASTGDVPAADSGDPYDQAPAF